MIYRRSDLISHSLNNAHLIANGNFRLRKIFESWHTGNTIESDNNSTLTKPLARQCSILYELHISILAPRKYLCALIVIFFYFTLLPYIFQRSPFLFTICQRFQTGNQKLVFFYILTRTCVVFIFWIWFFKVHLTPKFFSAGMKLCNIHIKNFIILSVSGIFKSFKNWQKVAELCYQLVHDRVSRGLALFLIWCHRLIYMALTLCEHACKTVCDVKSGIDPCLSPARSWDKAYRISGCTVARKNFRCCKKNVKSLLEQLQVCIFAEIHVVFGVRCTLT